MYKVLLTILMFNSSNASEINLSSDYFDNSKYHIIAENDVSKLYINDESISYVNKNFFEVIKSAIIKIEITQNNEKYTLINKFYYNCITKQNMILFTHLYNNQNQFIYEENNNALYWYSTDENSSSRKITDYVCKV